MQNITTNGKSFAIDRIDSFLWKTQKNNFTDKKCNLFSTLKADTQTSFFYIYG